MFTTANSPKLLAARTAFAATAITAAAALSAGVLAPNAGQVLRPHTEAASLAGDIRQITADVELLASQPVGVYTSGPMFEMLGLFGLGDPLSALTTIVDSLNVPVLTEAITHLVTALEEFGPLDTGLVNNHQEIYQRVNGLSYSADAMAALIGIEPSNPLYAAIKNAAGPMINQRRAVIAAESMGATQAARALRAMIDTVKAGSPSWGGDPANPSHVNPGVTAATALLFRNPSRPGGGLWGLFDPIASKFGLDLMNPEAGSYLSPDGQQVLNVSYTDIGLKYDLLSDIPTSLTNPLAWMNTLMGAAFPTYLIPDRDYLTTAVADVIPGALAGAADAAAATLDPSGGQGLSLVPVLGPFLNALHLLAPQLVDPFLALFEMPGNATYLTFDSGNLPLLEPLAVLPRLLSYVLNTDIPTPLIDTLKGVLTPLVDAGYQDARIVYTDGVPTVARSLDMAGVSPGLLGSTMSAVDFLQLPQVVANALVRGINENLLSPESFHLTLGGQDLSGILNNALVIGVAHAIRDALEAVRIAANPVYDKVEAALQPIAARLDQLASHPAAAAAASPAAARYPNEPPAVVAPAASSPPAVIDAPVGEGPPAGVPADPQPSAAVRPSRNASPLASPEDAPPPAGEAPPAAAAAPPAANDTSTTPSLPPADHPAATPDVAPGQEVLKPLALQPTVRGGASPGSGEAGDAGGRAGIPAAGGSAESGTASKAPAPRATRSAAR